MNKGKKQKEQSKKESTENTKKESVGKEIVSTLLYLAVVLLVVYLILHFVGQRTVVNGTSMENTLYNGENLIMDKLSYRFSDPERFDIVIFPGTEIDGSSSYFIKRIIGMPGETVQIIDGKVNIDGEVLESDTYGITDYIDNAGIANEPLVLGEDEYFCLGDNRPISLDSRYEEVGPVHKDEFVGKVWIRIWPLNQFGKVE